MNKFDKKSTFKYCLRQLAVIGFLVAGATACTPPPKDDIRFNEGHYAYEIADYTLAVKSLLPLAHGGHINSQFVLGEIFAEEVSNPFYNINRAITWYIKAANQNHPQAQYTLGKIFEFGSGVTADPNEAMYWYLKSAKNGYGLAQLQMAELHLLRQDIQPKLEEAYLWVILSLPKLKNEKLPEAERIRSLLAQKMTIEQIRSVEQEAQRRATGT